MNLKTFAFGASLICLGACGDNAPNPDALRGANFVSQQPGATITLAFDANEMMANGRVVNLYHGPYSVDGNKIKFGDMAATRMMGPMEAMTVEDEYFQFLPTVETYEFDDGRLVLRNGAGKEMVFGQVDELPSDE